MSYQVNVQVYRLGSKNARQHSALQFDPQDGRPPWSVEAIHERKFQCAMCNDVWYSHHDMKDHFITRHSDMCCIEPHNPNWFVHKTFNTKTVFRLAYFNHDKSICEGASLQYVQRVGEVQASEALEHLMEQWLVDLETQQYDLISNNCNHQVEKWCRQLGIKRPRRSVNFLATVANHLFG